MLLAALLAAAFHSETAFRYVLDTAGPLIPGELQYAELRGTLAGPVHARELRYTVANTRIRAETLEFDLSPWALLTGRIAMARLEANHLVVTLPPPEPGTADDSPVRPQDVLNALALPVHIQAQTILLKNAELRRHDATPLLQLDHLETSLDWNDKRLALNPLNARGPLFFLQGGVTLDLGGSHEATIDLAGEWTDSEFPIAGELRGRGDARELSLHANLRQPAQAVLDANLSDLLETPSWQGSLQIENLQPSVLRNGLPETAWSGTFRFNGNWQDTQVNGKARGDWPPANGIALELQARANAERVLLQSLHATAAAFDASADLEGELHYADTLRYAASGRIAQFRWPGFDMLTLKDTQFEADGDAKTLALNVRAMAGGGQLTVDGKLGYDNLRFDGALSGETLQLAFGDAALKLDTVSAEFNGTPQDYGATVQSRLQWNGLPPAELRARVNGGLEQLSAHIERLAWLDGKAAGPVQLEWREGLRVEAQLSAEGFELAQLDPQLAGQVGGKFVAAASFAGASPDVIVRLESLTGNLAGTALQGSGMLHFADGRLTTRGLNIRTGEARLELEDAVGAGFDFKLQVPSLAGLHPDLGGELRAHGHLEGMLDAPTVTFELAGSDLAWQNWRLATLNVNANIVRGAEGLSSLDIEAADAQVPWLETDGLALHLRGKRSDHVFDLHLNGAGRDGGGELEVKVAGGWRNDAWQGQFEELWMRHPATGLWQLMETDDERQLRLGVDALQISRHCLQGPSGSACLGPIARNGDGWQASAALDALPVAVIAGLLPAGLDIRGSIDGAFDIERRDSGLAGQAHFALSEGGIRQQAGEDAETLLGWDGGQLDVTLQDRRANGKLDIRLNGGGRITGSGRVDVPPEGKAQIDARLRANVDDLQLLPSLIPELSRLRGRLAAELRASGPLDAPDIHGSAQLRDASARILALGTDWNNIELDARADGRALSLRGQMESGGGRVTLQLDGRDTDDGFTGKARIEGDDFKAVHTPEADVDISPRLELELRNRDLQVSGEVLVPYARIQPRDLSGAVRPSEDQVIVNAEHTGDAQGLRVHAAITTRLGDDVRIDAFGLSARLEGRLAVAQQPGSPATATGKLLVAEGQYQAYGQDLTLAKGEIIYTGQPLSNPGLDIRAERRPQPDVLVGVAVRGPLSQPTANVYSDPAMPQTEALAYLLFGRSLAQATGEEEGQISEAAIALGLGGQKLLGNVGERLGVEEVRVEDVSNRERASLVLGKYLSPDLYVSYGIGLFDAVNTFRIRYRLSSKWMLEATSGLSSSADFIYTIER